MVLKMYVDFVFECINFKDIVSFIQFYSPSFTSKSVLNALTNIQYNYTRYNTSKAKMNFKKSNIHHFLFSWYLFGVIKNPLNLELKSHFQEHW